MLTQRSMYDKSKCFVIFSKPDLFYYFLDQNVFSSNYWYKNKLSSFGWAPTLPSNWYSWLIYPLLTWYSMSCIVQPVSRVKHINAPLMFLILLLFFQFKCDDVKCRVMIMLSCDHFNCLVLLNFIWKSKMWVRWKKHFSSLS